MIKSALKVATLFTLVLSLSLNAFAGKDRGGGNVFEAEFKQIGYELLNEIRSKGLKAEAIGFEPVRLEVALNEVQVLATDKPLSIEDMPRMAINSPHQKIIVFTNSSWMILNDYQKHLLVLHEYLRFVGVDDSEYTFAIKIEEMLKSTPVPSPVQAAPTQVQLVATSCVCENSFQYYQDLILIQAFSNGTARRTKLGTYKDPNYSGFGIDLSCPRAMRRNPNCSR